MIKSNLPVILLKNLVLLPHQDVRVEIKSQISKKVTEISKLYHDNEVLVVCPFNNLEENPDTSDLPKIGVVGKINSIIDLPNGNMRIIISGKYRVKILSYVNYSNEEDILDSIISNIEENESEVETSAYKRKLISTMEEYIDKNPFVSNSIISQMKNEASLSLLTDLIGNYLPLSFEKKLNLMLNCSAISRCKYIIKEIAIESAILDLETHIESEIKKGLDQEQKEFILKEKLKVIKDELGKTNTKDDDISTLKERLSSSHYPNRIKNKISEEIERYASSSEMSPDAGIRRNYIEYLLSVPWVYETKDEKDLLKIEKKLNSSHYGMNNAKDRILEYIAVKSISSEISSPIICLVGPPGVGKTTFAEAISHSLNRKFVKISLGGMSDSSELVGHRRAYIGSNPGKIVTSLIKCGSINPVFLLDEVDKLKKDYKGDPASTLLDILDISQNKRFVDNYIEEELDLSKILFVLTANDIASIPYALLDRLEIINISSYTDGEKLYICENYLIPNILKKHGLKNNVIKFEKDALIKIIKDYTNEPGVRELERNLNKIVRKVIMNHIKLSRKIVSVRIKEKDLVFYLDGESLNKNIIKKINTSGVVKAVASGNLGGSVVDIECSSFKGNGNFTFTGSLGDVTKESISVSISYIKSNAKYFKIDEDFFQKHDIHINFTQNSYPKDGPSAGAAITTAILSHIKNVQLSDEISMTGEITLKSNLLKVGGIKEKVIACHKNNIKTLFIPSDNYEDVENLDAEIRNNIDFISVDNYKEIYNKIFS